MGWVEAVEARFNRDPPSRSHAAQAFTPPDHESNVILDPTSTLIRSPAQAFTPSDHDSTVLSDRG
jgi:hypothetical protein